MSQSKTIEIVVDAGGSQVRAHAYGHGDVLLDTFEVRSSANPVRMGLDKSLLGIEAAIDGLLKRLGPRSLGRIACGIAGAGKPMIREALLGSLSRKYFCDIFVCSDAESLLEAAAERGPVVVLIAGTGAIAACKNEEGEILRQGGLGPPPGDPGSGRWLAVKARNDSSFSFADELDDFDIGPEMEALAVGGHQPAIQLLEECASMLIRLLVALGPKPGPLITEGGLITHSSVVRRAFLQRLHVDLPHLTLSESWQRAHWGALSLARRVDNNENVWWA